MAAGRDQTTIISNPKNYSADYNFLMAGQFLSEHVAVNRLKVRCYNREGLRQLQYCIVTDEGLRSRNVLLSTCFTATCSLKNCPTIPLL